MKRTWLKGYRQGVEDALKVLEPIVRMLEVLKANLAEEDISLEVGGTDCGDD